MKWQTLRNSEFASVVVSTLKQQLLGLTKCVNKPLCDDTQIKHITLDAICLSKLAKLSIF